MSNDINKKLDEILQRLDVLESKDKVQVKKTAAALKAAGAAIVDGKISVSLKSINKVLDAATADGISLILESMDVEKGQAELIILGRASKDANDLGEITDINELRYVAKPGNSRCQ